jgi:energy-converting hydrogenase Eha subunit A
MPVSTDRHKPQRKHIVAAPPSKEREPSSRWYAAVIFSLIAAGVLVIVINYMGLLPGGHSHNYIYLGAGGVAAGLLMALHYR